MVHGVVNSKSHGGVGSDTKSLKAKAKEVARKAFHTESLDTSNACDETAELLNDSPAFNSDKFLRSTRIGKSETTAKAISFIHGTAQVVTNPKAAIKHHATRKTAAKLAKSRPYLSKKADLEFLEAHDDLSRAESKRQTKLEGVEVESVDSDIHHCTGHIADMERAREEMRVAWVTTRHVQRVRAIDAISLPPFPDGSFFEEEDNCGYMKLNWSK